MESWARDSPIVARSGPQKMSPARVTPPPRATVPAVMSVRPMVAKLVGVPAAMRARAAMAVPELIFSSWAVLPSVLGMRVRPSSPA